MPLLLPFLGAPAMSETGSLVFHFTVLVLSLKYFLQPDLNDILPVPTSALRRSPKLCNYFTAFSNQPGAYKDS